MKKIALSLILLSGLFFNSCKNETLDPSTTDTRTEISKTWKCDEISDGQTNSYDVVITKDAANENQIIIKNFHNCGGTNEMKATVSTDKVITIANGSIPGLTYTLKNCIGTISASYQKIDWTYIINDPQTGDLQVTATYTPGTITKKKIQ